MPASSVTVVQALNHVMQSVTSVEKNERNQQQGWSFRGIDATTKAVAPALREHGVIVAPQVLEYEYNVEEFGRNATKMGHVRVKVKYCWYGPAGDCIETVSVGEATDAGDKATAKAMSVAFRTCILQTLCLPTDEPDPDSEVYERSSDKEPNSVPKPARRPAAEVSARDWAEAISKAETVDALRKTWKDAGAAGALQNKVTVEGVNLTVQEYLYKRSDELTAAKSNSAS